MKHILGVILRLACVLVATPVFAQQNPGFTQGELARDPSLLGAPPPIPNYESRIPAPLPPPPQPPVINGPLSERPQASFGR
jgi:hypothetical protein